MYGYDCYPPPASVETKSVSLGVDTEAASHLAITIALHWATVHGFPILPTTMIILMNMTTLVNK